MQVWRKGDRDSHGDTLHLVRGEGGGQVVRLGGEAGGSHVVIDLDRPGQLDQGKVVVRQMVVIVGIDEDLLHHPALLPALLQAVVVLPQDDLPVPGLLPAVEAVGGREDPLGVDESPATSEGSCRQCPASSSLSCPLSPLHLR